MTSVTSDAMLAWNALRVTAGLGPKRLARIAVELSERGQSASTLFSMGVSELAGLGIPPKLATAAADSLASPSEPPDALPEGGIVCPDDEAYPRARVSEAIPLPVILWTFGELTLLKAPGIAIAGSRRTTPQVLDLTADLSAVISKAGLNVVSGNAAGVDRSAHESALRFGTTTAVLAEGFERQQRRNWGGESEDSLLIVTGFEPGSIWTASRAMERNAHIAALADAVVVVAPA